jgi:porin
VFRDDFNPALTNLYWSQRFLDNRLAFVAGVVDVTDYVDVYGLVNVWTDFNSYAFSTNPTIYTPDQGLGAALRVMPTENVYILGDIADANGNPLLINPAFNPEKDLLAIFGIRGLVRF